MQLIWYPEAIEELHRQLAFCRKIHGPLATLRARDNVKREAGRLAISPTIGAKELLLEERQVEYRSLVIQPHFKLIYHIDESADTVYIVDFWNTLREPFALANRLK